MATVKRVMRVHRGRPRPKAVLQHEDSSEPAAVPALTSRAAHRRALAATERRERQVAALYELWRGVPDTDPSRLLQRIAERVTAAMDGHTCSLLLRERGGDTLRVAASVGLSQDVADSVTLVVGERIAGRVAASGQPVLINKDPNDHPLLTREGERPIGISVRPEVESALCAPLIGMDGEINGVLCLSRFSPAEAFTEADLRIFGLFAAQAGAAIAHARTVEDLTRSAQEAAAMEREMARTANLTALGQLAATVAHELRNPLSSIKGAAQFLLRECDGLPEQKSGMLHDFLTIVVDEVDGLGRLTTDLLEFARPTPPRREKRPLEDIVRAEVAFLRPELEAMGVSYVREAYLCSQSPFADVDAEQIGRALRNLLLNAAQAAVAIRHVGAPPSEIAVTLHEELVAGQRGQIRYALTVEDSGGGVPSEMRARLWEPFFTTKARGTGLGLAQVRQVAVAHGGAVAVADSTNLGGARFTIYLPREINTDSEREMNVSQQ
jgi:signal transduction histidine kinase